MDYLRDPEAIYRRSFEIVGAEADLARFSLFDATVAARMIHACGMVEIADRMIFSRNATEGGVAALQAGATILCDAEMVASGITRKHLPADNPVVCTLNDPQTADHANAIGNTRSAAAVDLWGDRMEGAVVAIGNAPTALFRLLELLEEGAPRPALILGLPVGFVGAGESKSELIAETFDVPYITLVGRLGGSAITSAAVNAIAMLAKGESR
ncbi:precorrin-8X methylmutase [Devosia pacifica]|uniref:Precorrin-8X methylmutase n=1 Tax=Devosia pacifica TaxID=1335967 RepID=A0A918VWB0_9HYPH|nr:precorrin-8X methylmutase [Devosia pacifica]GHA30851.1 precorrin-8X methylmutase [Devosia pacifica]